MNSTKNITKQPKTDFLWSFTGKVCGFLGIFITMSLTAKYLSPTDFANFSLIMSFIPAIVTILTFGQDISSSKLLIKGENAKNHRNYVFKTFTFSIIIFFTSIFLLNQYFKFYTNQYLIIAIILLVIFSSLLRIIADYSRAKNNFRNFILFNSIRSNGGVTMWLIFLSLFLYKLYTGTISLEIIFIYFATSCFLSLVIFYIYNPFKLKELQFFLKNLFYIDKQYKTFILTSFSLMLSSLLVIIRFDHDMWIVNFFGGKADLSLYAPIIKISALIMVPLAIFESMIPQKISFLYNSNNRKSLEHYIRKMSTYMFYSSSIILLLIFLFSEQILYFVFGEYFLSASDNLKLLSLAFIANITLGPCGPILLVIKHERLNVFVNFIYLIFSIFLGAFLVSKYGYTGMVITFITILTLIHITFYLLVRRLLKINTLPYFNLYKALR